MSECPTCGETKEAGPVCSDSFHISPSPSVVEVTVTAEMVRVALETWFGFPASERDPGAMAAVLIAALRVR